MYGSAALELIKEFETLVVQAYVDDENINIAMKLTDETKERLEREARSRAELRATIFNALTSKVD